MAENLIVVSAINLRSGGALSILNDCLDFLGNSYGDSYKIIALVHDKKKIESLNKIDFIEFPYSVKSYFLRLFYEYYFFKSLSRKLKPYLWLSLHDVTPNIEAQIQAVYCHNPSPFYRLKLSEVFLDPLFACFVFFYRFLYAIGINKNHYVIVQQDWLRNRFREMYTLPHDKIIVAYPEISTRKPDGLKIQKNDKNNSFIFFFPSFPRVFKNFDIICEAAEKLEKLGKANFSILLTIDGTENRYSKKLYEKYSSLRCLRFIGLLSRTKVFEHLMTCDCLLFPSKLETWGLPITEAKCFSKPILVADLPYAHETVGNYDKVLFFAPESADDLAEKMLRAIQGKFDSQVFDLPASPFVDTWKGLFEVLLKNYPHESIENK